MSLDSANSLGMSRADLRLPLPYAAPEGEIETLVANLFAEVFKLDRVGVNDDFFDLGGDSLMAISIAMSAANEGLTLSPQDLYEYPTLAALTASVDAAFASSGLAKPPAAEANPPVPPNIAYLLDRGLRDPGRWRFPLILHLDAAVSTDDIAAVLTALVNHHDALRLRLVERAGLWEQHIEAPTEFTGLVSRSLPADVDPASSEERAAVKGFVAELIADQQAEQGLSTAPVRAVHVTGSPGGPHYLGLGVLEMVADATSRQILATDLFTAFGQRLAGQDIRLEPVSTGWRDWSLRCASLATHPAALDTRTFWIEHASTVNRWLANANKTGPPGPDALVKLSSTLDVEQTSELDDARRRLRRSIQTIMLAALGRTIAQTTGDGVVAVDVAGEGRFVLRPDVDVRRTVGWFTTYYPVPVTCATGRGVTALRQLDAVHNTLKSVPHYGIGYGLLRYVHADTARVLGAQRAADIHFRYEGVIPEPSSLDTPVQFDPDTPVRDTIPGLGHAIELRTYRCSGAMHLDLWYDTRRIPAETAQALLRTFPTALSELIGECIAAEHDETALAGTAGAEPQAGALVDLSDLA